MRDTETTRRRLLALTAGVGSVALAGCSGLSLTGDESVTLDGEALRALTEDDAPDVPQTLPVDIQSSYLDESEARARQLLESVPSEFTSEQIPNGVIRRRLADTRERAADQLGRAQSAGAPYERLLQLQYARAEAQYAAAAWAAIDAGYTREDVFAETDEIRESLREFRDQWQYVGTDPVRAVVVHGALESEARSATGFLDSPGGRRDSSTALGVGELAEDLERARVSTADATHLLDRYTASLADPREVMQTFESARETLVSDLRTRRRERFGSDPESVEPESLVDQDISGTPAATVLRELADDLQYRELEADPRSDSLASDVLVAHDRFVRYRALDAVVSRIEAGETFSVESVDDVRRYRADAVDALEVARSGDVSPLTRHRLPALARQVRQADYELARVDDTVRVSWHQYTFADYVAVAAMAGETPAASKQVADVLSA